MPNRQRPPFEPVHCSLADLVGSDYVDALVAATAAVSGRDAAALADLAHTRVDVFPEAFQHRQVALAAQIGKPVCPPFAGSARGAGTAAFRQATKRAAAPLCGYGCYRVGEDGTLYLTTKSEHYHAPLGHAFPGYRLLDIARQLGIPNATHNNTRGHITRVLEERLVDAANRDRTDDRLDCVLNLETGSLAVEAALKLVLAQYYRHLPAEAARPREGQTPVILVVGSANGSLEANYHGTTLLTQTMRGMWPGFYARLEKTGAFRVAAVPPNDAQRFRHILDELSGQGCRAAAFFHEIIMMNYGARLLTPEYLRAVYLLCADRDIITVVDEIQSGMWHHDLFMFREWNLEPDMVAVGKGFPGGEYPASRLLLQSRHDTLSQFGALVTNGQEEIASLAYLVTMTWAQANAEVTRAVGDYYQNRLEELRRDHPDRIAAVDGCRHLCGLRFHEVEPAVAFAGKLNRLGLDISVQTYKADCPPVALTKLPLTMGFALVDEVLERMKTALN